jgi:hypothetical protein
MDADEAIMREVDGETVRVVFDLLSRVNRRIPIRLEMSCRSADDALM